MRAGVPVVVCRECSEEFDIESSPDVECCQRCAADHQWREGLALVDAGPRLGKSAGRARSYELINHASAGRIAQEV